MTLIKAFLLMTLWAVEGKTLCSTAVLLTEYILLAIMMVFQQPMRTRWMFKHLTETSFIWLILKRVILLVPVSTAIDKYITPRIDLAVRSKNVSSGRDAASVTPNSEGGEHTRITASFENVSDRDNTFHELPSIDETRGNISDEVRQLSVPRTHFDRQSNTHHRMSLG